MTPDQVIAIALAAVLAWAGIAKLRAPGPVARAAGVAPAAGRALGLVEAAVAVTLLVPLTRAGGGVAAAVLGAGFLAWAAAARARGARRVACGCFGAAGESPVAVVAVRAAFVLAGGLAVAAGAGRDTEISADAALWALVGVLAVAVAVLAVLVLALYRQVGVLHRRLGPRGPLEVAEEGPPVGGRAPGLDGLTGAGSELVVFSSPGCRLCRELAPAVRALARQGQAVVGVSEPDAPDDFARWGVPGTPFVVHVIDGRVASKGLVNTMEQLEELVRTGTDRVAARA